MDFIDLPSVSRATGKIRLPGSKSISNRFLLLAALAEGKTEIHDLLISDDTERMLEALQILGVEIKRKSGSNDFVVQGVAGTFPVKKADLFLGNAGTAFRPLTAALALSNGHYTLSGVPRMHERPIGDLVDALRALGAQINYLGNEGFPPLEIHPASLKDNAPIAVRGDASSQFLTALLMALPLARAGGSINVIGELISKPYIDITLKLMARFGVVVERGADDIDSSKEGWRHFRVPPNIRYQSPGVVHVEGDASSASYFLAAGALAGGPVRVEGVGRDSIQGDVRFADALIQMGAQVEFDASFEFGASWIELRGPIHGHLQAIDLDCNHIPDAAMTLAVMALFAEGTTTLRNIASWRVKETDRLHAMATELRKLGAEVEEGHDYLRITPPSAELIAKLAPNVAIDTYDDHRMAMCFSLVCLGGVPIRINDPKCVNKTYPNYFTDLQTLWSQ